MVEKDLECDYCYGDLFAYRADAPGERSLGEGSNPAWAAHGLASGATATCSCGDGSASGRT